MWTAEKLKSLLNKITSPTVQSEHSQISNNLELLFVLAPTSLEQIKYVNYRLSYSWRNNYSTPILTFGNLCLDQV